MMFHIFFQLIIYFNLWHLLESQSISMGWQSSTLISDNGLEFVPIDEESIFLFEINVDSISSCGHQCHSNVHCRIFNYNDEDHRCRLFQGDITLMGSIVSSSSSHSYVGSIQLRSEHFIDRGRSCSYCENSRYLTCINNTCQCQSNTFFNGYLCQSKNLLGFKCANETECRLDRNYTCLPRKQCGPISIQSGTTIGGYGNGTMGNDLNGLHGPWGLAVGVDESVYVSDFSNHRIIKLREGSLMGTIVAGTGISGTNTNQLNSPTGLYVDSSSNIYIVDKDNYRVMLWNKDATSGLMVAGTAKTGTSFSTFNEPHGLSIDSKGNIYVSDVSTHRVMKWSPNSLNGTRVAGSSTGTSGYSGEQLNFPSGLYFDHFNSYLYIADAFNYRIQRYYFGDSINVTTVAGGNGSRTGNHQLKTAYGVCVSKKTGDIYIADTFNHRIQRWSPGASTGVTIVGSGISGSSSTSLNAPYGVALNSNETYLYVTDRNNHRVQRFKLI